MNVLSIRGGGMRGLAPAMLLSQMEKQLGEPLYKHFDMIVGTSTGAILATALGLGIPASEIISFYCVDGPKIFTRRLAHRFGLLGSKYDGKGLMAALEARFESKLFSDCKTKVRVTTTNVESLKAVVLRNDDKSFTGKASIAAYCSAAAPTYFDPYTDLKGNYYADGGLYANNPALVAYHEAFRTTRATPGAPSLANSRFIILDIGCPQAKTHAANKPGIFGFGPNAISVMMEAGQNFVETICADALSANYLAVVPELGNASAALDCTSEDNLRALIATGLKAWSDNAIKIGEFLTRGSSLPNLKEK